MRLLRSTCADPTCAKARVLVVLLVWSLFAIAVPAAAHIIYVDDAGGGDYVTIEGGLGAASVDDTVLVAAGTYTEYALAMPSGVTLLGETGDPADVIIDGSWSDYIMSCTGFSPSTEIRGITFTHGFAYVEHGGGLSCFNSNVSVRDCVFRENQTNLGSGGGVAVDGGLPSFDGCTFESNWSGEGGGMSVLNAAELGISNCLFVDNESGSVGGGMYVGYGSSAIIGNTVFIGNGADEGNAIYSTDSSHVTVLSCTFYENSAGSMSVIRGVLNSWIDVVHSIIAENAVSEPISCDGSARSAAVLTCCNVWGHPEGDYVGCIAGQDSLNGNFSADPMFCNPEAGNLQIHENSPCASAPGCGLVGALGVGCGPRIWYVPDDAPTIAAGIDSASVGDTVIVRTGTYEEYALQMKSDITLIGETGDPADVVIEGNYYGQIMWGTGLSEFTVISGITFTHGYAYGSNGAALGMTSSYATVEDCVFYQNETYFSSGGAVSVSGGNPAFIGCRFEANVSDDFGGAMYIVNSSPSISDCSFLNNSSYSLGGALYLASSSSPMIGFTVFAGNYADDGGAIYCTGDSDPSLENCTVYDNSAPGSGSAIACYLGSSANVAQTIIAENTASGPFYCDGSPGAAATLACCDVWGNDVGDYVGCIAGQGSIDGNFSENPYFCNAEGGDLTIHENSPCANTPGCGMVGALGIGCVPHTIVVPTDEGSIQAGINAAVPGDTVLVLCGTYYDYDLVMKSGITLVSETGQPDCVTIDALTYGRILNGTDLDPSTRIEGITFASGSNPDGAAMYLDNSSPVVVNCAFTDNYAYGLSGGAAIAAFGGVPAFLGCEFIGNHSGTQAGAVYLSYSTPSFTDCRFLNNNSDWDGGAVFFDEGTVASFDHVVFSENWSADSAGGAIACVDSSSVFIEASTFYGNSAPGAGGAIRVGGFSSAYVDSSIIAFNTGTPGLDCDGTSDATLSCSDVYGNPAGDYVGCLAGQNGVDGNFSLDPVFCDAPGDLELHADSPCADAPGCGLIGALGVGCGPRIWYVPDDAPTIAAAIDSAFAGDTIIVRTGIYGENNLTMKSGVTLEGETGDPDDVTIDGEGGARIFNCDGLSPDTAIRGITIANGQSYYEPGAGMYVTDSYLTVEDCVFFLNSTYSSDGGGVGVSGGEPMFIGCSFLSNSSEYSGGGMHVASSSPTIAECWFGNNSAVSYGGGLYLEWSSPIVDHCVFVSNQSFEGGAVGCMGSSPQIEFCTFYDNDVTTYGGALMCYEGSNPTLTNTIIAGHDGGEPVVCDGVRSGVALSCCDVWGNAGGDYSGCLAGQGGVDGNFSADPLFCEEGEVTSFEVAACSPCADAPGCGQIGALGVGCGGRVWVVPIDAPTIAAAIDSAAVCDTVLILSGTYEEHDIELKPYVTIVGDTNPPGVTIDAQGLGIVLTAYQDDGAVLRNLTITGGSGVEGPGAFEAYESYVQLFDVTFDSNSGSHGGAINSYADSCHLTDCVFTGNTAYLGGAVYLGYHNGARFTRCVFEGNSATGGSSGALYIAGPGTLVECDFIGNESSYGGGGLAFGAQEVSLDLIDCTFVQNHAGGIGGGLMAEASGPSPPELNLEGCVFRGNTSDGAGGAAFVTDGMTATFTGCTLHENSALGYGAGIVSDSTGTTVVLDHTIISGSTSGEAVSCPDGDVGAVTCSDIYGNAGGDWVGCLAPFAPPTNDNFSLDPMYCDPASGDLRLDMSSPCVDAPGCGQVGALGVGCGIIWYVPDDAPTIAAGIDSAGPGDTVIVRPGVYYEHDISMKSGIYLRSETLDPADVVINAVGGDQRGLSCVDVDSTTVIQGLTIAGGDAPAGGGMAISNASPRVLDCIIRNNTATAEGGGVLCVGSSPRFERCRFESNSADSGGAFNCSLGSPSFLECVFAGNMVSYDGGAMSCGDGAEPSFTRCVFDANMAIGGDGSAFYCASDMRAPATITVDHTIIAFGNVAPAYCAGTASVTLTCCDVYGNAGGDYVGCLAGQEGVNGNISDDPLFCGGDDPDNPYTLKSTSPCAAENNPGCGQIGPYGIGCAGLVDWDAGGDGETWEDPDNWDPDQVPGENDHARILLDGTYSVYYNSVSDIWALTHGATSGIQTLDIETGVLAVTHGATNTQEIVVRDGATFDASVGRDSSVVVNEPDATFTLDGGDLIGTGAFLNRGLFEKIGPATSHVALMFENQEFARGGTGTVEAEAGTLSLEGETNNDGRLNVNSGATAITSQHFIRGERQSAGSLTNRGLVTVAPGGRLGADPTLAIANEADGIVMLEDGDLVGSGTFMNRGLLKKIGSGTSHVLLTLENLVEARGGLGTVDAEAGTLSLEGETNNDGRLNVNSGATAITSQHFIRAKEGGREEAAFDNSGQVVIERRGRFVVDATGSAWSSGLFYTRGSTSVAPGASFASEGNLLVGYGGAIYAAGEVSNEVGGNLINNGLTHVLDGGLLTNDGYFDHRENGLLKGSGTVDNSVGVAAIKGLVAPGDSHGTLTYIGNFVQAPTSEISFEIGGHDQGVNYDLLNITGISIFKGAIDLSFTGGFVPVLDDSFQVIAHAEGGGFRDTDFDCFAGLGVSDSLYMEPIQRIGEFLFRAVGGSTGNAKPVASDDVASVTGYEPITIDVLANDADADLDPLRVIVLKLEDTNGAAYINEADSLVTYAAAPGFAGADSFDYVVTDCLGGSDTARVVIDVTAPPDVWHVPDDSPTIAGALALASPGDTVMVACGTYYESDIVVPQGVTVVSEIGDPDCVIIDASGRAGRGLFFADVDSTTIVAGVSVTGAASDAPGGGMYCQSASPKLIDCRFFGNTAIAGGGAAVDDLSSPSFEGCAFEENTADSGGGMLCLGGSTPDIDECLFADNGAPSGSGGALAADEQAVPKLTGCTLVGNYALEGGGLFFGEGAVGNVDRTIIALSVDSEAVACAGGGVAELSCSDVFGNDGGDWVGCIEDQADINGNFSLDPAFCDAEVGDYHVLPDSPCADAEGCGLVGAFAAGCVADPEISVEPASFAFNVGEGGTATDVLRIYDLGRDDLSWLIRENGPVPEVSDGRPLTLKAEVLPSDAATVLEPVGPPIPHVDVEKGGDDPRGGRGPTRGAGGPDAFGYAWIDNSEPFGPTYDWREISGVGTALTLSDDDHEDVALPFAFPFYAVYKTSVRISSNGYLTFGAGAADYSNDPIPDPWEPNDVVAPFWDDLNPELGGNVYYYHDAVREEFIVQYDGIHDYYGAGPYTFEVVLTPAGSIVFLYDEIEGDPVGATVGIESASGTTGLEVAFNAPYVHSKLAVHIDDPAPWLTEDPPSGVVSGLGDVSVTIEVDTHGLMPGLHLVTLVVETNDADEPEVMIPVSLWITGTGIEEGLPTKYVLHGNYPNPFNPTTEIRYDLPAPAVVSLRVYSLAGRLVRELVGAERQLPGRYAIPWNGRDGSGERVASGVYYYKLEADGKALTSRMVLLK